MCYFRCLKKIFATDILSNNRTQNVTFYLNSFYIIIDFNNWKHKILLKLMKIDKVKNLTYDYQSQSQKKKIFKHYATKSYFN